MSPTNNSDAPGALLSLQYSRKHPTTSFWTRTRKTTFRYLGIGAGLTIGLLCSSSSAFAAWEVRYHCSGSDTHNGPPQNAPGFPERDSPHAWTSLVTGDVMLEFPDPNIDEWGVDSTARSSTGTIQVDFAWVPQGPNDPPPQSLSVKVFSSAKAKSSLREVRNQVGNPALETSNGLGNASQTLENGPSEFSQRSKGARLFTFKVPADGIVHLPPHTLSVSTTPPEGAEEDGVPLYPGANLEYKVLEDNRSVFISSSDIELSYHRTMDGNQPTSKYRNGIAPVPFVVPMLNEKGAGLLNERNADGSMNVDSVAIWDSAEQKWMAQGNYIANILNFSNPSVKWNWNGGAPTQDAQVRLDGGYSPLTITYPASPGSWETYHNRLYLGGTAGNVGIISSTLNLMVVDSDGTIGNNTYTITWHKPYEKISSLPNGRQMKHCYWICPTPISDGGGTSFVDVPESHFEFGAAIDDVLVVTKYVGLPTEGISALNDLFKALIDLSNMVGETEPEIKQVDISQVNSPYAFRSAIRERPENISNMTVQQRNNWLSMMNPPSQDNMEQFLVNYDCFAARVRYHHKKNVLADKYDIHGFESPNHVLSCDVTEKYDWENYYVPTSTTPTAPPTSDTEVPTSYNVN